MKAALALCMVAIASLGSATAAERNLRPWDRETPGVVPVGSTVANTARTDTTDYGVKFTNGQPALGCQRTMRQVTTPDGKAGETATFSCRW
jgi:hypothetical protein